MARRPRTRKALEQAVRELLDEHLPDAARVHPPDARGGISMAMTADLERAYDYLLAAPRTTAYGRFLSEHDAAIVVAKTFANGGSMRLATQLDQNDNRYGKVLASLKTAGALDALVPGKEPGPEQLLVWGALLWAEQSVFESLRYVGARGGAADGFYALVAEHPTRAADIVAFACQRGTVDPDVLRVVLGVASGPLLDGAL